MKNEQGFTLLELIVVMAIIMILATTAIPSMVIWYHKSIVTEACETLLAMDKALDKVIEETGDLPYTWDQDYFIRYGTSMGYKYVQNAQGWMVDPLNRWAYGFEVVDGNTIVLSAYPMESVRNMLKIPSVDIALTIERSSPTEDLSEIHYKRRASQYYKGLVDQFITGVYYINQ